MSLPLYVNGLSRRVYSDLPWLMVCLLLVSGCAGKKIDLLTSGVDEEASEASEPAGDSRRADDRPQRSVETRHLIAGRDGNKPVARRAAFPLPEKQSDSEDRLARRFRTMLGGKDAKTAVATTDPFVDTQERSPSDSPASDSADTSSIDGLLASLKRDTPDPAAAKSKNWWDEEPASAAAASSPTIAATEQTFVEEFDSRLDRLRAKLASSPERSDRDDVPLADLAAESTDVAKRNAGTTTDDEYNPFADRTVVKSTLGSPTAADPQTAADLLTESSPPETELFAGSRDESRSAIKDRIEQMLSDARRERTAGELDRAYRTVLDAQALAVLERVDFAADEQNPQELARLIEIELRGGESEFAAPDELPHIAARPTSSPESSFPPFDFPELSPVAGSWDDLRDRSEKASDDPSVEVADAAAGSGVDLFPPDDDFPSEAARSDWDGKSSPFGGSSLEGENGAAKGIRLTIHEGLDDSLESPGASADQLPGFTEVDNQELLSNVSETRDRVFEVSKLEWPSLPKLKSDEARSTLSRGPIRVAQAPELALNEEMIVASADATEAGAKSSSDSGPLLSQVWRSQPVWFVAGLVLLVIALRLLPWPRDEAAE